MESASDRPLRSASETVGPHLLGRLFRPDPRDWSIAQLLEIAEPPDSILQKTVEQVLAETTYFSDWRSYLVFWRWLKKQREPAKPAGDTTPGWPLNIQLDQGQTGHCVGSAGLGGSTRCLSRVTTRTRTHTPCTTSAR